MIPLVFVQDGNGRDAFGWRIPNLMDYVKLVAGTAVSMLVPTGARHVYFSYATSLMGNVMVQYDTASMLTNGFFIASSVNNTLTGAGRVGSRVEQAPGLRAIPGVTGICLICQYPGDMTISWFG